MSSKLLQICRDYLAVRYKETLGCNFANSLDSLNEGTQPVWRWVRADDLTTEVNSNEDNQGGALFDPEIGVLAYILVFTDSTSVRKQVLRTLNLRSQLSMERNYKEVPTVNDDLRGAWRIVVHWLVCGEELKKNWVDQIMDLRRETGFSEEISFDAVFFAEGELKSKLETHGLPRLLLTTRQVFKKKHSGEADRWMSANHLVEEALKHFPSGFQSTEQQAAAAEIVQAAHAYVKQTRVPTSTQEPKEPSTIRSIRVQNLRNLRDITVDFGLQPVTARIIHGPNGTGKSTFCEAMSLALFKSSSRYRAFSNRQKEGDVSAVDRRSHYFEKYLWPISGTGSPRITLDGKDVSLNLVEPSKTEEVDLAMCGTFLTQDASEEFARMQAPDLGVRVLRGYSDLADYVDTFAESRFTQANTARQEFLKRLGLNASITKLQTAFERIARLQIDKNLPPFPEAAVAWLDRLSRISIFSNAGTLGRQWRTWGQDGARATLCSDIPQATDKSETQKYIRKYLEDYNALAAATSEVIKNVEAKVETMRKDLDAVPGRLKAWGDWLGKRVQQPKSPTSNEAEKFKTRLETLQAQQQDILKRGQSAKAHFEHLTQVEAFVRQTWADSRKDECPTCGAHHADAGGVLKVIETSRKAVSEEREDLRSKFTKLNSEIEALQKQLSNLGQNQCPLSDEEIGQLTQTLQWLVPEGNQLAEWITVPAQRDQLLSGISTLCQVPSKQSSIPAETEAERVTDLLITEFRNAEKTFEAPNNWKPVRAKLTETLATIVNEHLPKTLECLWSELYMNLTAAPWLLPERPRINVRPRRGEKTAMVCINDRLARYILNQSEIHVLGLAWFFARYLTHGRFQHAYMIMDDPAQELDQTSFRDLCRLWETWTRLHRVYERDFKLIILLNQESRALDAARATNGIVTVFGWTQEQQETLRAVKVIGDGFYAPQPATVFSVHR